MNRSIKNILAITALALTFAPALRCEDTQAQTVSTNKLQSAINYVKNIRTPLTPQETLAQHIAQADITGFKSGYKTFMQSDVTPEERIATLQALAITAQEVKQALQTELDTMTDAQANKTMLAKGAAQTISGLYGLGMALYSGLYYYTLTKGQTMDIDASISGNILKTPLVPIIKYPKIMFEKAILPALEKMGVGHCMLGFFIIDPTSGLTQPQADRYKTALVTGSIIAPVLIGSLLSWYSIKNIKNGWNYKAFVEQQIANIDEINEFIQEQLKLS